MVKNIVVANKNTIDKKIPPKGKRYFSLLKIVMEKFFLWVQKCEFGVMFFYSVLCFPEKNGEFFMRYFKKKIVGEEFGEFFLCISLLLIS